MGIFRDERGTTAVEAAFVLPFYFAFIFGIIEFGNVYWEYNSIQYVADEVARCSAVSNCNAGTTAYGGAANIWSSASAAAAEMSINTNATCGNYTGTKVTITHPMASLTGFFPNIMPAPFNQLAVQSCYPKPS
jgi:Flp pilus assembly protein TadG